VLIAEGYVLKIGDFGLSRDVTDKDYYRKTGKVSLPVASVTVYIIKLVTQELMSSQRQ